MRRPAFLSAVLALAALLGALLWWRRNPSACPYSQRIWVELPHPVITRRRLLDVLRPQAGERLLEIGPGTGYYTLPVARALGPQGRLTIVDVQPAMLEHTTACARRVGLEPRLVAVECDARTLPFADEAFDGAFLVTVLGEIPDQEAALRELRRVVRPGGRLVIGEICADPHMVTWRALSARAAATGWEPPARSGVPGAYFAVARPASAAEPAHASQHEPAA